MLSKQDKVRLIESAHDVLDIILTQKTKNKQEVAFLLKIIVESFEEVEDVMVPLNTNLVKLNNIKKAIHKYYLEQPKDALELSELYRIIERELTLEV